MTRHAVGEFHIDEPAADARPIEQSRIDSDDLAAEPARRVDQVAAMGQE
jgi:hypothetical protein